ncbi:pre-mRNA-splicing factor CWC25 homolog [Panonychus citri]|uniref:pre-mRNA-splicing factor CWC25 homolog n=1 Tax=Panonychus citri TaxID=50023 RepID=UPI0023072F67|nr:pre-mRNA-splicing factor CWC25 homolog [Panonychus citri]
MSEQKLDWMYKGVSGLVDRESYLTGRRIDKTFELAEREEKGERIDVPVHESVPQSILDLPSTSRFNNRLSADDPLVAMKQRQLEEARKILNNPLKMKKIKELIEAEKKSSTSSSIVKKKKKKSKKKHKKDKKKEHKKKHKKHDR